MSEYISRYKKLAGEHEHNDNIGSSYWTNMIYLFTLVAVNARKPWSRARKKEVSRVPHFSHFFFYRVFSKAHKTLTLETLPSPGKPEG